MHPSAGRAILSIAKFGGGNRLLAGLGIPSNVVLHACLDAAAARRNARAGALDIGLAGFDHRDITQKRLPAGLGELAEVLRDARFDPSGTGLNPGAKLLNFRPADFSRRRLLRRRRDWRNQKKGDQDKAY